MEMNLTGLRPWGGLPEASLEEADIVVVGIPYDGSAVYRQGAAQAPVALRRLSAAMPPITERGRSLARHSIYDLGDVPLTGGVEAGWEEVADRLAEVPARALLTVVGGDHCSAIPVIAAQARRHGPDLAVVWVDAHPDLCDSSRGDRWSCGCALSRALEVSRLRPSAAVLVGSRDFDVEEVDLIERESMLMLPSATVVRNPVAAGREVAAAVAGRPVHISFDIDALDPAFAPGTQIPSAAGLTTRQALDFFETLAGHSSLAGLDVMEVAPPLDPESITALAALKIVFEFWGFALD
jgi:agmatinase